MSLKSFFGIKDINQKVSEWVVLDLQFDDLNKSLDILSDDQIRFNSEFFSVVQ